MTWRQALGLDGRLPVDYGWRGAVRVYLLRLAVLVGVSAGLTALLVAAALLDHLWRSL